MRNAQIIAVANQKGGVGKTTTTHNLGNSLARQGKKVIMIDLDPQSNLTMCMGFQNPDELPCTMAHIIKGLIDEDFTLQKEEYILTAEGCDLIPSSIQLSGIEPSLINAMSRENDIQKPAESVIPNSVFVKLGLDRERFIIPITFGLVLTISVGLFIVIRRKRKIN